MAEHKSGTRLQFLPDEPLPTGYPKPNLSETERVEIYGVDELRAVIIVNRDTETQVTTRIRGLWLSSQNRDLARELLAMIRDRHTSPGRRTVLNINGAQSAILREFEAEGFPFTAQIMTKSVEGDVDTLLPKGITYRDMDEIELQSFLTHVQDTLAQQEMANEDGAITLQAAEERAHRTMSHLLPDRGSTAGHNFVGILEGDDSPVKVGWLWTYMDTKKGKSFCYDIEIEESMRGRGLGRKTIAVWEKVAREQGAKTLALNVFKGNDLALKLYRGTGFGPESAVYILGG